MEMSSILSSAEVVGCCATTSPHDLLHTLAPQTWRIITAFIRGPFRRIHSQHSATGFQGVVNYATSIPLNGPRPTNR